LETNVASSDRDVFDKLTSDPESSREIDFIAYAMFAYEKSEWMRHWEKSKGQPPTSTEIDNWISNLTDYQFNQMRAKAFEFFDTAARDYLADEIEAARQEALRSAIVTEVKASGGFWRQLSLALITAVLAPIIIGGVIALSLIYNDWFPTVRAISGAEQPAKSPVTSPAH
jgi:hypothetical protein